ncbi:G2/mitotic-specific cyclin-B3-like [Polyodon spathula]|uniref:G2/mitotic-specific cyclin-B3-like n=1 Tax=Polyodon spathula TaxID=7913 RepID=UPI001B7E53A3|nr:G2/mitotic-specific cyclin-B3-like [Polyodon spathula]XP_041075775.1 G2/mitotic-specific cyclin-B3-like [Polyodon spathula]
MPVSRGTKKTSKIPKLSSKPGSTENVRSEKESIQTKRSPSSPQGAPKKRSAFGDITNANKIQTVQPKQKEAGKTLIKKAQKSTNVTTNNQTNLKSVDKIPTKESPPAELEQKDVQKSEEKKNNFLSEEKPVEIPAIDDIDKENLEDPCLSAEYAKDIFDYLKKREEKFVIPNYMDKQSDLNKEMRAILVDWMIEVQENFELNHETLYLAVKLVDHFLAETVCMRETLQLIGSSAMLISSKFEERCPPCVDDFMYICDDAYKREELIAMEMNILKTLHFDISIPIAYRFLRRYAKCARVSIETLTLARYICELTLQELDFVPERASHLAAACLLLTVSMKGLGGWTPTLQYYTGYTAEELVGLVKRLNRLITYPDDKLKAVRNKYSHKVFFEVAKLKPLDMLKLQEIISEYVEKLP